MTWCRQKDKQITLYLCIQPGAKEEGVVGLYNGHLKIRLQVPAIEGRANKSLLQFLAKCFKVPVAQIEIIRGKQSRYKVVLITDSKISPDDALGLK